MRSGAFDSVIVIQQPTEGPPNDYGTPTEAWADVATLRAQIIQSSTEEFIRNYGASDQTVIIFRTRWIDGVTNACRVVYDAQVHNIKETKEIGRRKGLDIRTVSIGEAVA